MEAPDRAPSQADGATVDGADAAEDSLQDITSEEEDDDQLPELRASSQPELRYRRGSDLDRASPVDEYRFLKAFVPEEVLRDLDNIARGGTIRPFHKTFDAAVGFFDISGFSLLGDRLRQREEEQAEFMPSNAGKGRGAAELTKYLDLILTLLCNVIYEYHGDVVKFAGDAMLILWKADADTGMTVEDACVRAAACAHQALLMAYTMLTNSDDSLLADLGLHCGLGVSRIVGVHAGGVGGRLEYFLGGPALKQCMDAEKNSEKGEVVMSREVASILNACTETGRKTSNASYASLDSGSQRSQRPRTLIAAMDLESIPDSELKDGTETQCVRLRSIDVNEDALRRAGRSADADVKDFARAAQALRGYMPRNMVDAVIAAGIASQGRVRSMPVSDSRRISTVFISLLHAPTPVSDDPDALSIMNAAVRSVQEACEKQCCTLRQVMVDDKGTTAIVVAGLQNFHFEDNAARAINVVQYLRNAKVPLSAGITTGEAFCGVIGRKKRSEYAVVGHMINMSARLMNAALPNELLVCEQTKEEASKRFRFMETRKNLKVKGSQKRISAYSPIGEASVALSLRDAPPIVGCDAARRAIKEAFKSSRKGGAGGTILIEGDMGTGKSLLLSHAHEELLNMGFSPVEAIADASEQHVQFSMWQKVLKMLLAPLREEPRANLLTPIRGRRTTESVPNGRQAQAQPPQQAQPLLQPQRMAVAKDGPLRTDELMLFLRNEARDTPFPSSPGASLSPTGEQQPGRSFRRTVHGEGGAGVYPLASSPRGTAAPRPFDTALRPDAGVRREHLSLLNCICPGVVEAAGGEATLQRSMADKIELLAEIIISILRRSQRHRLADRRMSINPAAASGPSTARRVALIIDNAQLLDHLSWALLKSVREKMRGLLLLLSYRPMCQRHQDRHFIEDIAAATPTLPIGGVDGNDYSGDGAGVSVQGGVVKVSLSVLMPAQIVSLLTQRFGVSYTPPEELITYLRQQTGGNPQNVIDHVRALIQSEDVRIDGRRAFVVVGQLRATQHSIMAHTKAHITERCDSLEPKAKKLLQACSVLCFFGAPDELPHADDEDGAEEKTERTGEPSTSSGRGSAGGGSGESAEGRGALPLERGASTGGANKDVLAHLYVTFMKDDGASTDKTDFGVRIKTLIENAFLYPAGKDAVAFCDARELQVVYEQTSPPSLRCNLHRGIVNFYMKSGDLWKLHDDLPRMLSMSRFLGNHSRLAEDFGRAAAFLSKTVRVALAMGNADEARHWCDVISNDLQHAQVKIEDDEKERWEILLPYYMAQIAALEEDWDASEQHLLEMTARVEDARAAAEAADGERPMRSSLLRNFGRIIPMMSFRRRSDAESSEAVASAVEYAELMLRNLRRRKALAKILQDFEGMLHQQNRIIASNDCLCQDGDCGHD